MASAEALLNIEVVYSPRAGEVERCELRLAAGSTVHDALQASGLLQRHPLLAGAGLQVGVWGRMQGLQAPLRERDRVEIYRPLTVDPKEARRQRYRGQRARDELSGTRKR